MTDDKKTLKFKQITRGTHQGALFGLTDEGEVFQYNNEKEFKGWYKLNMEEMIID